MPRDDKPDDKPPARHAAREIAHTSADVSHFDATIIMNQFANGRSVIETRDRIIDRFAVGSGQMADTTIHVETGGPYFNRPGNTGVAYRPRTNCQFRTHIQTRMCVYTFVNCNLNKLLRS